MNPVRPQEGLLTIGGVSRATGISIEALRTWERRYGFPQPLRRPSGHRRYPLQVVARLRLIKQAMESGLRPGQAVQAIGSSGPEPTLIESVQALDGPGLERTLQSRLTALGPMDFLHQELLPLLQSLGQRCAEGSLQVLHEHFASERIEAFLSREWRPLSDSNSGPRIVLATFSGERHVLTLHIAAWVLVRHGLRILFLGGDTPLLEIARAARSSRADAVLTAFSSCSQPESNRQDLTDLRLLLPPTVPLLAGGPNALQISGVPWFSSFPELSHWASSFRGEKV